MKNLVALIVLLIFLLSCQTKNSQQATSDPLPLTFSLTEIWRSDTVMKTPESVIYDAARNVLYVANMNRVDEGETGFISKMDTDGTVLELEWISGLIEPRGMGIYGDLLFATDMNRLIVVDIEKGEVVKTIPVDGAVFLNDLTIAKDGTVYFSDSRGSKVQIYKDGEVSDWFPVYPKPNGLFDQGDDMLICATEVGEVRLVNKTTGKHEVIASGIAGDGIQNTGIEGYYIVSEWTGRIHIIGQDTIQTILDTSEENINSADFGYDPVKKIVFLPTFSDNRVVAYELKVKG